jgi:N-acyl-L-homoserine lactone synthetase
MIHLVTPANAILYASQLEEMHRLRWRIYVEERGWRELREMQPEPGLERDQYDDVRAHYLLAVDGDGGVQGAMRVRPADDRSLLLDRFSHLLDDPAALADRTDVWELTRLLRAPLSRDREGLVRYSMNCALIEFSISRGVRRLVAESETFLLPMTRRAWGAKVRPLGLPHAYEEGEIIAVELIPDKEALSMMRAAGRVESPQFFEHPAPWRAYGHDPLAAAAAVEALYGAPPTGIAPEVVAVREPAVLDAA